MMHGQKNMKLHFYVQVTYVTMKLVPNLTNRCK